MPMFCLLGIFTVTELWVNLPKSPNAATVSIFMQLISAPESNKHEKMKPPVSILNVVPHSVPLLIVNTCEGSLSQFKYSLGLYLVGSQLVSFPKILAVKLPTTWVKAASYNCSEILKKNTETFMFNSINGLGVSISRPLCLLDLFTQ